MDAVAIALGAQKLPDLSGLTVTVAGDFVLDQYLHGQTERISREAPVPIVRFEREELKLGGAGNVANNLAALGVRVRAVGSVGRDWAGRALLELCGKAGVDASRLEARPGQETPLKTRILAGALHTTRQQLLRLDRGGPSNAGARVAAALASAARGADAVVISDYGAGNAGAPLARVARALARRLPVCVDSRHALGLFGGVTVAKPNLPELAALAGVAIQGEAALARAARKLLLDRRWQALLVTRGRDGLTLFRRDARPRHWPVHGSAEAVDVTGAGDTVLAAFAAVLAATGEPEIAAEIANVAGGLVVQKPGTATVGPAELEAALASR